MTREVKRRPARLNAGKAVPLCFFLAVWVIYLLTIATDNIVNDAYASSLSAWRIATTGAPWMDGVDTSTLSGTTHLDSWLVRGADGHLVHNRFAGTILPAVPFYWLASLWTPSFSIAGGGYAAATLTAAAATLLLLALRRLLPTQLAVAAAAVFALGTPTWTVSADGMWSHGVTQLAIAGAAWSASRGQWLSGGVWIGIGMLARPHIALIAAVMGLGLAWSRRDPRIALAMAIPTTASLGLLALWNHTIFGRWSLRGGYDDYVVDNIASGPGDGILHQVANYVGFVGAPDRGIFVWTPVLLMLLPHVIAAWKSLPDWVRWMAIGGLLYTFAQLQVNNFAGGIGLYGYRHGLELVVCLLPAYALSAQTAGRAVRVAIFPVVALQAMAFATGAISERYFWDLESLFTDNAFWLVLRTETPWLPASVGVIVAMAFVAGVMHDRRRQQQRRAVARADVLTDAG